MPVSNTEHPGLEAIRTIVVATDFSPDADAARDWGVDVARVHQARIVLVHALETDLPALAVPPSPLGQRTVQMLQQSCAKITARGVDAVADYHVDRPWKAVPAVAEKIGADLIVLGARGRTNLSGKLLGSTADRIIRTTSLPVVVVRGEPRRATAIESVLVACDFSEESARAMTVSIRLIRQPEQPVRIVLLHVIPLEIAFPDPTLAASGALPQFTPADPEYWRGMEERAIKHLEALAAPLRSATWQVEVKTARALPGEAILEQARAMKAQLIAIGTQGRSGLNRFFLGSVAERVLHHAECPVLTVRKFHHPDPAPMP